MNRKHVLRGVTTCLVALVAAAPASAGTIHVPADAPSLQAAIDLAVEGDTILVADGTWMGPDNRNLLVSGKNLVIRSEHGAAQCTINCQDLGRAFELFRCGSGTRIEGFTIKAGLVGNGEGNGNGVVIDGGNPTLRDCVFKACGSTYSGFHIGGAGGGVALFRGSTARIEDCIFENNKAEFGGGIYASDSSPVITRCSFVGNSAKAYIYLILPYWEGSGGAIALSGCNGFSITDCLFDDNESVNKSGAISANPYPLESMSGRISRCTFVRNNVVGSHDFSVPVAGTVVSVGLSDFRTEVDLAVDHCIFWENPTIEGPLNPDEGMAVTWCDVQGGYPDPSIIDVDPEFVDIAGGDLRLLPDSPCIDVGPRVFRPQGEFEDLDHAPRLLDGDLDGALALDVGAYEFTNVELEVTGSSAPGDTLTLDVTGEPGLLSIVVLGFGLVDTPRLVPFLGYQLVDLRSGWQPVAGPAVIPYGGTLTIPASVPPLTELFLVPVAWDPTTRFGNFGGWVEVTVE